MTNWLLSAPLIIPFLTAIVLALCATRSQLKALLICLSAVLLCVHSACLLGLVIQSGIQATQVGNWPAPFGITLVADTLSAMMVAISSVISLAASIYSLDSETEKNNPFALCLMQILLGGINGAFITGDLFNLFVWFEVLLLSSFVLVSTGRTRPALAGALKYVLLNSISSLMFLSAVGLIYGSLGTVNLAHLAQTISQTQPGVKLYTGFTMLLVAFAIKSALFPLFFWLPASYHHTTPAISAVFAGLITKVGVYALFRVMTLFPLDISAHQQALLWISVLTMLVGVMGAASDFTVRRILSFHIISQVGYMTLALAIGTPQAIAAGIFYIIHHILAKANLFLVGGLVERACNSPSLKLQGGLSNFPILGILFLVPALALAGVPPFSGFFAKLTVFDAALRSDEILALCVALIVGLLTLFSMTKIWNEAFWKPRDASAEVLERLPLAPQVASGLLAALTIAIGIFPGRLYHLAQRATEELLSRDGYIDAVLKTLG